MRRYQIVPWILLILSIINVTLAAPVVLREIRHTYIDQVDVREDTISASRSEKRDYESEKLWRRLDVSPPAVHPAPLESDYESAPDSLNSYQTGTSEFQQASPVVETPPSVVSPVGSESHRTQSSTQSSNEGGSGFEPEPVAVPASQQKSFLSKWVSKSKSFLSKLATKSKNFFSKVAGKLKLWRRTSFESLSAWPGPGVSRMRPRGTF